MTPREAEITFALEGVPGVVEVYVLAPHHAVVRGLCYAVKIAPGGGHLAAAHFALRRVLTHDECSTVLFFTVELPPMLRERATRLDLTLTEREGAASRVAPAPLDHGPAPRVPGFRWMVVAADPAVARDLAGAFGASLPIVESDPVAALERTRNESFHLIVCDAQLALGESDFLVQLYAFDVLVARRVVLLASDGERDRLFARLDELQLWNSVIAKPARKTTLEEVVETGSVVQTWSIPVLSPRRDVLADPPRPAVAVRRVLVVDDDSTTHMLLASGGEALEVTVTEDEWEASDLVTSGELDLVVCSFAMRTRGGTPFYRFLWNASPDIKRRFVFIARPDMAPTSSADGRGPAVIARPVTREVLVKLLDPG